MPEPLAAVLLELPQRGQLPAWKDLKAQAASVRARGAALHLDGARLWESTPFYGKTPAAIAALSGVSSPGRRALPPNRRACAWSS